MHTLFLLTGKTDDEYVKKFNAVFQCPVLLDHCNVCWIDITGREELLRKIGIDPRKALTELHAQDENQRIHSEMDAYILLMSKVPLLKPIAWLIGLPLIRPLLARIYHCQVNRRLRRSGRL